MFVYMSDVCACARGAMLLKWVGLQDDVYAYMLAVIRIDEQQKNATLGA